MIFLDSDWSRFYLRIRETITLYTFRCDKIEVEKSVKLGNAVSRTTSEHHFCIFQREQERLKKTLEKKNSQIAERNQCRQEKVQQDTEVVTALTQLCKEREEKVAQLERELKSLAINLAETSARQNIGSADKATITDELTNDRIPSPSLDDQQIEDETMISKPYETQPRRRRVVRSSSGKNSSASTLPPTPPRSGSGRRKTSAMSRYSTKAIK